jgi:hypothetical protein
LSEAAITENDRDAVALETRNWVERVVIGLNLCPFAKAVQVKGQIRYSVSLAKTPENLRSDLVRELQFLVDADPVATDTTLLIHPNVLSDFLDYNDFLEVADAVIEGLHLQGKLQIASFHPQYQFANTKADDIGNCTNRSPYPTLHLLREASVARAVAAFPEASDLFEKNIATMSKLGRAGWQKLR